MSFTRAISRVVSGIQPTGIPHLGNYFGAIQQWVELANKRTTCHSGTELTCDVPIFNIADVHASDETFGTKLMYNTLSTTASLIALGVDPSKCILFRQSDLWEIIYLARILYSFVSTSRLSRMTQYKDKSRSGHSFNHGLINYPVLQAADILIFQADLVPVGEDQLQHIELTRDIAKKFNQSMQAEFFTLPDPLLNNSTHAHRIKSLRAPDKKMSKSDVDKMSTIEVIDEPEVIVAKCKKAMTDCTSKVYYDADSRPGVSNLMRIYHLATGDSLEKIEKDFEHKDTAGFKLHLADVLVDKFAGARDEYKRLLKEPEYLEKVLRMSEDRARPIVTSTLDPVKQFKGLGKRNR